jgi:hypothetical protein
MADYVLDEKTRKSLLGLMPFSQKGTIDYTPEQFANFPENVRPIFKQRSFTREEIKEVKSVISKTDSPDYDSQIREFTRKTVQGWDNLYDLSTCKKIDFVADEDKGADKKLFESIPILVVSKILNNALVISGIISQENLGLKSLPESTPE